AGTADDGPPSLLVPQVPPQDPALLPGLSPGAGYPVVPDTGHRTRSPAADTGEDLLAPRRSDRRRDEGSHRTGPPKKGSAPASALGAAVEVVVVVALALVLAVVVKTFFVQAFYIPSESMETTLLVGDRVLVSKLTPGPFALHRGDVVVFKDPDNWLPPSAPPDDGQVRAAVRTALTFVGLLPQDSGEHLIKRVIGLPGDTVKCCDAKGRVIVNGVPVDELYLRPGVAPSDKPFSITVPEGRLWVMGDNRPFSADSRYHMDLAGGGTVPVSDVVGKAFVIVWPFGRAGGLGIPDEVFADVPAAPGGS
uniref:signal peptidase I n=1 Tax=Kineosporia sp. R_H_3 TaxID=1961848 RepID=UPI00351062B2